MALTIEFSRRSTKQLLTILAYYDKRNGTDTYSRLLLKSLLADLRRLAVMPLASSPSTRHDVRFFLLDGVHHHFSVQHAQFDGTQHSIVCTKAA